MRRPNMTTALRASVAAAFSAVALMALSASPAFGAYSHSTVEKTFTAGACERIRDVAVVESSETIYVDCEKGFFNGGTVIEKYDFNGNPVDFSAKKPYISGNTIFEDPGGEEKRIGRIAVDTSGGPNNGLIYVCGDVNIDIFNPAGEFIGIVKQKTEGGAGNFNLDVTTGPDGYVYVTSQNPGGRISKYDLAWHEVRRCTPRRNSTSPSRCSCGSTQPVPPGSRAATRSSGNAGEPLEVRGRPVPDEPQRHARRQLLQLSGTARIGPRRALAIHHWDGIDLRRSATDRRNERCRH